MADNLSILHNQGRNIKHGFKLKHNFVEFVNIQITHTSASDVIEM